MRQMENRLYLKENSKNHINPPVSILADSQCHLNLTYFTLSFCLFNPQSLELNLSNNLLYGFECISLLTCRAALFTDWIANALGFLPLSSCAPPSSVFFAFFFSRFFPACRGWWDFLLSSSSAIFYERDCYSNHNFSIGSTWSDKISADITAKNLTCCRKFCPPKSFVCRNILSAEI